MKKLISSILLMQSFCVSNAFSLDLPSFAPPINHLSNELGDELPNPKIKYDNNAGRVGVSFDVPLAKGNHPVRSKLKFSYNAQVYFNLGFGVGVELSIPSFQKLYRHDRADYLYDSGSSVLELKMVDGELIEQSLGEFNQYSVLTDGFRVTKTNGKVEVFDNEGRITEERYPGLGNVLYYKWNDQYLESIMLPNKEIVKFEYIDCDLKDDIIKNGDMDVSYSGRWYNQTKCLDVISQAGKEIRFSYNKYRNLLSVKWRDGQFPIFSGAYEVLKKSDDRLVEVSINQNNISSGTPTKDSILLIGNNEIVEFHNENTFYANQKFQKNKIYSYFEGGTIAQIFPSDLNNDGTTDYLVYYAELKAGSTAYQNHDLNPDIFEDNTKYEYPSWGAIKLETRMGSLVNGEIVFKKSKAYALSSKFLVATPENNFSAITSAGGHDSDVVAKGESALTFNSTPLIGDFDGNGLSDILLCGDVNFIAYNNKKGFIEQPSGITCPKKSIAYDVNSDGISDVLSKGEVFLGSPAGFRKVTSYPDELNAVLNKIPEDNGLPHGVFDHNFDGIPEVTAESNILSLVDLGRDNNLEVFKVGNSSEYFSWSIFPTVPIMSEAKYAQGGKISFAYDIKSSLPVVTKVTKDNIQNYPVSFVIDYFDPVLDPFTSQFTGFGLVSKLEETTAHSKGVKTISQYFRENEKESIFKRTQKHGLLEHVYSCFVESCDDLVASILSGKPLRRQWFRKKSMHYKISYPYDDDRYFIFNDSIFIENNTISSNIAMAAKVKDTYTKKTEYSDYRPWGPSRAIVTECEDCLDTEFGALEVATLLKQEVTNFDLVDDRVLTTMTTIYGNPNRTKKHLSKIEYKYSGSLNVGDFVRHKTEYSEKDGSNNWVTSEFLNSKGLISKEISPFGAVTETIYSDDLLTVEKSLIGKNTVTRVHDKFGNVLNEVDEGQDAQRTLRYTYNPDQSLSGVETDELILDIEHTLSDVGYTRGVDVKSKDDETGGVVRYMADGFGEHLYSTYAVDGKEVISKRTVFDSAGRKIEEYAPVVMGDEDRDILINRYLYGDNGKIESVENIIDEVLHSKKYHGSSIASYKNNRFIREVTKGELEKVNHFRSNLHSMTIDQQSDGNMHRINDYIYRRNLKGEITSVSLQNGHSLFNQEIYPDSIVVNDLLEAKRDSYGNISEIAFDGEIIQSYEFDSLNRLIKSVLPELNASHNITYNADNTLAKEIIVTGNDTITIDKTYNSLKEISSETYGLNNKGLEKLTYSWLGNYLISLKPYVESIEYSESGVLSEVKFKNLKLEVSSTPSGRVLGQSMGGLGQKLSYDSESRVSIQKTISSQKDEVFVYHYDQDSALVEKATKSYEIKRDSYRNLIADGIQYLDTKSGKIKSLDGKMVHYRTNESIISVGNETYLASNLHRIDGDLIKYLRIANKLVGALVCSTSGCEFYPIYTDHLNSVRGIFDDSGNLLVERKYDSWGRLIDTVYTQGSKSKKLDKRIRYDFAGMVRPYKSEYLLSRSRVYSPAHGEWHKVDPLLYSNPEIFLHDGRYLESYGLAYTQGDPVNYIDPAGFFKITFFGGFQSSGGVGAGVAGASGGWIEFNTSPLGVETGTYATGTFGAHLGASAGAGVEGGVMFGGKETLEGSTLQVGGSGGVLGKFGADVVVSPGGDDGYVFHEDTRVGVSLNVSLGIGLEGHGRVGKGKMWDFDNDYEESDFRFYEEKGGDQFELELEFDFSDHDSDRDGGPRGDYDRFERNSDYADNDSAGSER